ncbi:MAG TPA: glycoside hydrolase family 76 protein [Verrucomicrobiae bacterium]|jgi:predicted alpha-1,6-mannanase (GH76 family)
MNFSKTLTGIFVLFIALLLNVSASAFTAKDANATFNSFNSAFYSQNGTNGYFKDTQTGGVTYFWGQAEEIECVIDTYEWKTNNEGPSMITNLLNGFLSNNGSSWTYNIYNDDIMWAIMAFARGGMDTSKTNYCNIAKANFDACYARAWDTTLGGGLWWTTDKTGKNACVNGPAAIAASLLYQIYGDTNYLNKATAIYNWERSVLLVTNSGAICDNISSNGVLGTWASTYNQGTFIGAANFLGRTNDAILAANFTMMNLTTGGVLPEYGIAGNNSGFNAIFLRWLVHFMKQRNLQSLYEPWLQTNATAAWNNQRSDNLSWCQWLHASPAGTNFYSWDCIASYEALQAADPTQVAAVSSLPNNAAGYWPLDATIGSTTIDASGNGNNGVISGAVSLTSSGRIGGAFNFNGLNSSVQITNLIANDFSLVFWVKTTQTAGTGQWYNGAGLVDGDVSLTKNDFGTALIGGKFGFGVGNPDTTIVSTSAINDGTWHQCVATRQLASGAISVYVDGNLQMTGTGNRNTLNASARLLFGAIASGNGFFNGALDDIKIFNRALSSSEVAALYASRTTAPATAPVNLNVMPGNAQVRLSWGDAPMASSYNIKRSLVNGGPYVTLTNVTASSYTDASVIINGRTYYYVVSAVNDLGESSNSLPASASASGLVAWFKADAITNLNNGAAVSCWPDSTGNGFNAVQNLTANQPVYVSSVLNGQPVIRFNAATNSYLWFYRPVADDFTMIFVYQSSQGISTGTSFWNGAGLINGEQNGTVDDFGTSLNANGQILAGTGNPDTTLHSGNGFANGQPHVVTFKRAKSTGSIALYVDGTLVSLGTGGTQSLTSPNVLTLGAQQVLNNFLTGDIAEVLIYNTVLADIDRLGLERALKCKYGMVGGATPTAPTALTLAAGNRQIVMNWLMPAGASSYTLWRSTNNGVSYQAIATGLTESSYVDVSAANGQINYYKITASDACGAGTYSTVSSVTLPLPALTMSFSANSLGVSWPSWASDWGLYAATNLAPPVNWLPVNNPVISSSNQFKVNIPVDSGTRFFRLAAP